MSDTADALRVAPYDGDAAAWDGFGQRQSGWTAFHRYAWREVLRRSHGLETPFLAARDASGALRGILPLVRQRSRIFGHFLVSMPFVNYGGPLGDDAAIRALAEYADTMSLRDGAGLLELRSARELPLDFPVSHRKITVVLALDGGPDAVFGRFKAKLRSQVRRPAKDGVTVRMGADQVDAFYAVFAEHMRDLGSPAQPLGFFSEIAERLGDDAWFAVAWHEGKPIAAGAGLRWDAEFEITWASALRAYNRLSPNMAVYWALIERAAADGLTRFNFGRCTPGSATHKFKLQWGAVDEALWWYSGRSSRVAGTPSPDSAKFRLAVRVWQRLPVALTRVVGPRIVRNIP